MNGYHLAKSLSTRLIKRPFKLLKQFSVYTPYRQLSEQRGGGHDRNTWICIYVSTALYVLALSLSGSQGHVAATHEYMSLLVMTVRVAPPPCYVGWL